MRKFDVASNAVMMKKLLPIVLFLLAGQAVAQNVVVNKVELLGDKIIVHYELDDSNPNHEYQIGLYASKDNFAAPLAKVKGDVGTEIKPGATKQIEWNMREEFGSYKGRLTLEVRGRVFVPVVKLQNFDLGKSYKRGKTYKINWKPGNSNSINIELYKGDERISGDVNQANNGGYTLVVPSHARTGKDYRIKISDSKNSDDVVYSGLFKVTPKIPLLVKLLPIAVVGGVVAALSGGGGKGDGGGGGTPNTDTSKIELPGLPN